MPRLSLSTWSLHRHLGPMYRPAGDGSGRLIPHDATPGALSLLEVPAEIAARGIGTLEICHFHFPRTDSGYIDELRAAVQEAGVELFSLLIDAGDITNPDPTKREEDLRWIRGWLEIAGRCGAAHARVIAGDAAPNGDDGPIRLSAENLRALARVGRDCGVRVITENFRPLTQCADTLLAILDRCEGEVGLCADFGNFGGPTKYDALAAILPRADSVHAKAHYPQAGQMDREDFLRCLNLAREARFDGPYSLIFDGPGREWESLAEIQQEVARYL